MTDVFMLIHSYGPEDTRDENWKLIGIYSSRAKAQAALERVKDEPGFRSRQDGFEIIPHRLDRDAWVEGFVHAWPDGSMTSADE